MKIRGALALGALAALCGCQTDNPNDYTQIGYGPSFEVAHAKCDMVKGSVDRGYFAFGSPGFVAGAGLGNALGNLAAEDEFMKNCLILNGWKRIPPGQKQMAYAAPAPAPSQMATPKVSPAYYAPGSWINGAMLEYAATSKQCRAGQRASCTTADRLQRQLKAAGIDP
jgi:hypothetical protein